MMPIETLVRVGAAAQKLQPELQKLRKSTEDLEANFLKSLVKEMRKGTQEVHFGKSTGGDIYNDMFDDAISSALAKSSSLGISKMFYQATSRPLINQALIEQGVSKQPANLAPEGATPNGTKKS